MAKLPLILLPTPLHRLDRMSSELGIDLWIKRDDLTGFAMGGNKGRKLEYLIADAVAQNATAVVTCGAIQSNFIRQLGAAAAMAGLRCAAAVMHLPYEDEPAPDRDSIGPTGGNALLDRILAVDMRVHPDGHWETLYQRQEELAQEYEAAGHRVYRIPVGGSSALGAYAFLKAGEEIKSQSEPFDWIVFASSSGSTQTGLAHCYRGSNTKVLGIACDPEPEIVHDFAELSAELGRFTGDPKSIRAEEFLLDLDWVGPGYGVPSEAGQAALRRLARTEGIFLDPVYSAKAFSAVVGLAERGSLAGRILFWHTGGLPALFTLPDG